MKTKLLISRAFRKISRAFRKNSHENEAINFNMLDKNFNIKYFEIFPNSRV